jgi:ABC-type polysaccharide/polyol phosphate export permease
MMSETGMPAIHSFRRWVSERMRGSGAFVLVGSVLAHRRLVKELARREMTDAHAGQATGAVWLVVHPIVLFAVYALLSPRCALAIADNLITWFTWFTYLPDWRHGY